MTTKALATAADAPGNSRGIRRMDLTAGSWLLPLLSVCVVLVTIEGLVRSGVISQAAFPPVSDDLNAVFELIGEGSFWTAVGQTLVGWAIGLALAAALGVPIGIMIGVSPLLYHAVRATVEFLRPIPSVALIPLVVLVYGTGMSSKIFLATFAAFWPILMQTLYGVRDVDPVATDTARTFGLGRYQRLVRVTLPSAVPYIATGLRISSTVSLILAVTAELVIGAPGLGREINVAQSGGAFDVMYALIIATGLLGWALNLLLSNAERRVLHWHPSQRSERTAW